MIDLFFMGGWQFMSLLSLVALGCIAVIIGNLMGRENLNFLKELGIFGLCLGIIGQLIGLYQAFVVLEHTGAEVATSLIAGGLKVSMITMLYGTVIFLFTRAYIILRKLNLKGR